MGQTLRIESATRVSFITSRVRNSQLVFANNKPLEDRLLALVARNQERHKAVLYALVLEGSHFHNCAMFPKANRALFERDLNSAVANTIKRCVPDFGSGGVWERRYAEQEIYGNLALEDKFFYCALQPVLDGIYSDVRKSPAYNSFWDAVAGIERKINDVNWTAYHNARRKNPNVDIANYTVERTLAYTRLPGYESISQKEYQEHMTKRLLELQEKIVAERRALGLTFLDEEAAKVCCTDFAKDPKVSTRTSPYPVVITSSKEDYRERITNYFRIRAEYKEASRRYRAGDLTVVFPPGTYKPPLLVPH